MDIQVNSIPEVERIIKALSQRIYIMETQTRDNKQFHNVMGNSNSIYAVCICTDDLMNGMHICTCMDFKFRKNNIKCCKHIYLILFRVHLIEPKSIINERYHYMIDDFNQMRINIATQRKLPSKALAFEYMLMDEPTDAKESECCAVCYENFDSNENEKLCWCVECKRGLHLDCIQRWFKFNQTCPLCRYQY